MAREPVALTIAGSDSSGGAGIQADLKTFTVLGVYGASVLTALTAQNTRGVQSIHAIPPEFVTAQLESVLSDLDVRAMKTGMLATSGIIAAVAAKLDSHPDIVTVVDPVMIATSGDPLIAPDAIAAMRDELLPRATLITPNLNEAAALLGQAVAATDNDIEQQAAALLGRGARAVLIKGGHGSGDEARDYYLAGDAGFWLTSKRIATRNTHGTGCTLSAAIVAGLVTGEPLPDAVRSAKTFLTAALKSGQDRPVGAGSGPVDHLFAQRSAV